MYINNNVHNEKNEYIFYFKSSLVLSDFIIKKIIDQNNFRKCYIKYMIIYLIIYVCV